MDFDTRFLNRSFFLTLCVCLLVLSSNIAWSLRGYNSLQKNEIDNQNKQTLTVWEKINDSVYVLEPFSFPGYIVLRQFLAKTEDRKLVSFEVIQGRAKVVFE